MKEKKLDLGQKIDNNLIQMVISSTTTNKQKKILAIMKYLQYHPFATLREIKINTGISISTVHDLIKVIKAKFNTELNFSEKKLKEKVT